VSGHHPWSELVERTTRRRRTTETLGLVLAERERQDAKFGDQSGKTLLQHFAVLAEEFGEVAREVCEWGAHGNATPERFQALKKELVQTAAVCVEILENSEAWGEECEPENPSMTETWAFGLDKGPDGVHRQEPELERGMQVEDYSGA
jgi:hypothetical protein